MSFKKYKKKYTFDEPPVTNPKSCNNCRRQPTCEKSKMVVWCGYWAKKENAK